MKILFVLPSYEPSWAYGGTVTATVNLCRELARQGEDVTVWTNNCDGQGGTIDVALEQLYELSGVKVRYFSTNFETRKAFLSWDMVRFAHRHIGEFDIVDLSMIWQLTGFFIAREMRIQRVPYVVTPHSSLMAHAFLGVGNQTIKKLYWRLFGKATIRKAQRVHYLCNGEQRESEKTLRVPYYVIPNGVPLPDGARRTENRQKVREKHKLSQDSFLLLSLGRIHHKKQLHLVLQALPELISSGLDIKLLVVGNIEDLDYYEVLRGIEAEMGLADHIVWLSSIPHEQVNAYYHAADLLVLTSLIEGVSMAVTEAMAQGLPLLGSYGIANADDLIADKAGIIVDQDPQSVANLLRNLVVDPMQLQDLRKNALCSVRARYDVGVVAQQTLVTFSDLIAAAKP